LLLKNFDEIIDGLFKRQITDEVETLLRRYDRYLEDLADDWQQHILDSGSWPSSGLVSQNKFYGLKVQSRQPNNTDGERIAVVVSDALRFEMGTELLERLQHRSSTQKRLTASLEPMFATIPSYTQLGMAALLPHKQLEIELNDLNVKVDGHPSEGLAYRLAILQAATNNANTYKAETLLLKQSQMEPSALSYIYHDVIDHVGDDRDTQHQVFSEADKAFDELGRLVDVLFANGYKEVLITADHGFIYQRSNLDTLSFVDVESLPNLKAVGLAKHSRRFIVAATIPIDESLIQFKAEQLTLEGDYTVAIPKGIRRLRLRGSGSAYVHGGASLQEVVVPLLHIKKGGTIKGQSRPADVDLFDVGNTVLTATSVKATLFQVQPVGDSVIPSEVTVGIFSRDDKLVSEEKIIALDSASTNSEERKTAFSIRLLADASNYAEVELRVRRKHGNTNKYDVIKTQRYTMRRVFGDDF
jgi:uncharacterized protein (TIGR02687 family)